MTDRIDWWMATILQIIGVYSLALKLMPVADCYWVMLIGSALAMVAAHRDKNYALITLNIAFTVSNILGIWSWS